MIAALLHAGPDGGIHDFILGMLLLPWSVVIYGAYAFTKRVAARLLRDEEEK